MPMYLASNTIPDISFAVHQCYQFIHKTKASSDTDVNIIWQYPQGTKDKVQLFNISKKIVDNCYVDESF